MISEYRKKPVKVRAVQWTGTNLEEVKRFVGDKLIYSINDAAWEVGKAAPNVVLRIRTLEGEHIANVNDYIIKGVAGEFYPCKPEIFAATYDDAIYEDHDILNDPADVFYENAIKENNWSGKITDPPTDPRKAIHILIRHLLGKKWYVSISESDDQVITAAVYDILKKYRAHDETFGQRVSRVVFLPYNRRKRNRVSHK